MNIFRPEDFGAAADGVTNDALALWQALDAAQNGGTVLLQPGKTYYIAPVEEAEIAQFSSSAGLSREGKKRFAAIL